MATRLYFPADEAAAVSPAFQTGNDTTAAVRRRLSHTKGSSAITIGSTISWTAGSSGLDRQYVSDGMAAGITFDSTVTVSGQVMTREYNNLDNVNEVFLYLFAFSNDGSTLLRVLNHGIRTTGEFINNATHRNLSLSIADTLNVDDDDGTYVTSAGDRLVVEISYKDASGTTPQASAKWGENATDLPVNETQTTDGAGWIEFSNTITFSGTGGHRLALLGVGH